MVKIRVVHAYEMLDRNSERNRSFRKLEYRWKDNIKTDTTDMVNWIHFPQDKTRDLLLLTS